MPRHVPLSIPTPSPRRNTSTASGRPGKAAWEGVLAQSLPAFRKHTHSPTENPSPTPPARPILAAEAEAAAAAEKGLPLGLDGRPGQRDIATKAVGFPIFLLIRLLELPLLAVRRAGAKSVQGGFANGRCSIEICISPRGVAAT